MYWFFVVCNTWRWSGETEASTEDQQEEYEDAAAICVEYDYRASSLSLWGVSTGVSGAQHLIRGLDSRAAETTCFTNSHSDDMNI